MNFNQFKRFVIIALDNSAHRMPQEADIEEYVSLLVQELEEVGEVEENE